MEWKDGMEVKQSSEFVCRVGAQLNITIAVHRDCKVMNWHTTLQALLQVIYTKPLDITILFPIVTETHQTTKLTVKHKMECGIDSMLGTLALQNKCLDVLR